MTLRSVNPRDGSLTAEFDTFTPGRIESTLAQAEEAFHGHRRSSHSARARGLREAARILLDRKSLWAEMLTEEMGKTLESASAEVEKCALVCRYYAEHGERFLRDVPVETDAGQSFVTWRPLGPVLAVMPWNFPFWQVFRCAAPAVMAGNVVLLKHASNVPRAALSLQQIFEEAGFAPGVFRTLLVESSQVRHVVEDPRVRAVSVTGSLRAGKSVASAAGADVKKTVLELGGSDAFIVMPTADVDAAIESGVTARTINNGQSCIAAKRFIVHTDVYERFVSGFVERCERLRVGDPRDAETDVGPLAMERVRARLEKQIGDAVEHGATVLCGARSIEGSGYYFEPGVIAGISPQASVYSEEVFGPVASMFEVESLDRAIALANDVPYGLGSSIWTNDRRESTYAVNELEAGATFVNAIVQSDPRLPFGGVKASGYGRELWQAGIREFVNCKTVSLA